ncbi:MAG: cyanoexosortase B [Oscillatoriaceae bacterium SKW80]|nr:cyanoexosortase B [Oscillatoriaceae bacterium SKYG93]MCX8121277.1 cyanoexosortase B [Oscillatoriaceae bacterium SKW80]MDW8453389.1 cyanoexosortase B [Oscillatoriaceae cyanobacterium SKYGB_i_bin93]HIK26744.1 cyanoexosortase B [Oscillatoriaceae cyanobacterium M7585_C2015_266]
MQIFRKFFHIVERNLFAASIILLLTILYAPLIVHWYCGWLKIYKISLEHEYFSHGLIGLPFSAYISWLNRSKWHSLPDNFHPLGCLLLGLGGAFYISGLPDLVNLSFPFILTGIILYLKGIAGLKQQGFSLLFIFLATPTEIPYLIAPYTLPLQSFIAACAGFILTQFGLDVTVVQINLYVGGKIVEVAPHCAGLKMLFTCLYVALMLLYWRGNWRSHSLVVMFLTSTVVISIAANILRNTLLTLFYGTSQEKAFQWLHEGWGGDFYSALMLGLLVLLIDWLEKLKDFFSQEEESLHLPRREAELRDSANSNREEF